jgi:YVTN family beta-propeller protein
MLAIAHDGRRAYTANVGPGTVSVLDLKARKLVTTIPISSNTQRISISSDDSMVFTADQTRPRLAVIDTATNRIARWIDLPAIAYGTASLHRGGTLLVTMGGADGALAVVDLKTMKVSHQIPVGPRPQEVLVAPDDRTAYVSLFGAHTVVAVDLSTWTVSKTIDVGEKADGMAWAAIKP